jgi:hypothetical protein
MIVGIHGESLASSISALSAHKKCGVVCVTVFKINIIYFILGYSTVLCRISMHSFVVP